jgi:exodeoxyribonuclease VII large subunit
LSSRLPQNPAAGEPVYTVSQLNREVRLLLERRFPALWVAGEISNLARPDSGHIYFSLKDANAQVRCAMFRNANRTLKFRAENGQQVLMRARVGLFDARGEYQLIVEHMEPAGDGLLLRKLEELKARLAAEGLFDPALKKPLPGLPRRIGLITSPTGAALRDILQILRRRFPLIPVVIYPVQVQGERARHDIVTALATAQARQECDVLILARGGGSLEDLWAFNEEIVARAMHACPIPIVTGVGHEIDFTIADLVADVRAPTPSGAAELVVPDWREWLKTAIFVQRQAEVGVGNLLERLESRTTTLEKRLKRCHPGFTLRQHTQRLDELRMRMGAATSRTLQLRKLHVGHASRRLAQATPAGLIRRCESCLARDALRLRVAMRTQLAGIRERLAVAAAGLNGLSPLRTLDRGYAIIRDSGTGDIVRRAADLKRDQMIEATVAAGSFTARVQDISPDKQSS